jgi:hypothetical protein
MVALLDLWLPIVLSAVFVFIASSVIHMATPLHKSDFKKLPNEDAVLDALRPHGVPLGTFVFPHAGSMKAMGSPEFAAKQAHGPVGFVTILPNGPVNMGKHLAQWFALSLVISVVSAYVAGIALPPGADSMAVMRITATVAFTGYGLSSATDSIWKGVSWAITARFLFDGLVYAVATGVVFLWLWPGA